MRVADTAALAAKAAAARARREAENRHTDRPVRSAPKPATPEYPVWDPGDSLDDVDTTAVDEAASTEYMLSVVQNMPILDAYRRYVDKPLPSREPDERGELTVRCPLPGHEDRNPSANLNTHDNVFVCYACNEGGDPLVMIGRILGLDHRNPQEFMELSKTVCEDLGYEFYTDTFGHRRILPPGGITTTAPVDDVPVHGDGTGLDDMFDPEQALADGTIGRSKEADMPIPDWDHLDSLSEVGGTAGRKTAVSKALQARKQHVSEAETTVKNTETAVEQPKKAEKPSRTVDFSRFRSNPFTKAFAGPEKRTETPVSDENTPETDENDTDTIDFDNSGPAAPPPIDYPSIDWRNIIPTGSFVYEYCAHATRHDDVIEEFAFWNALAAVGLALGRDVALNDAPPVFGNLYLCHVARSGTGKSQSSRLLVDLVSEALSQVTILPNPGSGEALVEAFVDEEPNPADPKNPLIKPVVGLYEATELSGLTAPMKREGSSLEKYLLDLYDARQEISHKTRTGGLLKAVEPFCTMITSVQPGIVREVVTQRLVRSGFANRIIWVYGPEKTQKPLKSAFEQVEGITHLVASLRGLWQAKRSIEKSHLPDGTKIVKWDPAAQEMYERFHYDVMIPTLNTDTQQLISRANLMMKKLILLLTMNMLKPTVIPEAVEQAIALWPYLVRTYALVGADVGSNDGKEAENLVIEKVKELTKRLARPVSASELLSQSLKSYKLIHDTEHLNRLIKNMVISGALVEHAPRNVRGPKTPRYAVPGFKAKG